MRTETEAIVGLGLLNRNLFMYKLPQKIVIGNTEKHFAKIEVFGTYKYMYI